jgi:hypothetical protein
MVSALLLTSAQTLPGHSDIPVGATFTKYSGNGLLAAIHVMYIYIKETSSVKGGL